MGKTRSLYYEIFNLLKKSQFNLGFRLQNPKLFSLIKKNKKYKNIHSGCRCFILGNGPSLNNQDLSLLENEYVFTVNQIARHKDFEKIKTNYHFWADPVFFQVSENNKEDLELLNIHKSINTIDNKPECFFPLEAIDFIKNFKLDDIINVNIYKSGLIFTDNFKKDIHYDNITPSFNTVVQWAITMAIYMGFSEIYLLGCDTTTIITRINAALKEGTMQYAYEITANEKSRIQKVEDNYTMETKFMTEVGVLRGYRLLYEYTLKKGIKLRNCSTSTIVDSIPKEKYEDVLLRGSLSEQHSKKI